MPGKRKKNKRAATAKIIESVACEHCRGSGRVHRVADNISVADALAAMAKLRSDGGWLLPGGIDAEVCVDGVDSLVHELSERLADDRLDSLAEEFQLGSWEITGIDTVRWRRYWTIGDMLRNRAACYLDAKRRSAV